MTKKHSAVENFRKNLQDFLDSGVTVTSLSRESGVNYVHIWRLLNGSTANPTIQTCEALAAACGRSLTEMLEPPKRGA